MSVIRNLSAKIKPSRNSAPVAAGTGDVQTGTEVDMISFESCLFIVVLGAVTSTGTATLDVKNSDTSGTYGSGTVDTLAGTSAPVGTTGDSNKLLILDIHRPQRRYLRAQVTRATANVVIESIIAIPYNPIHAPHIQASAAIAGLTSSSDIVRLNNPTPSAT